MNYPSSQLTQFPCQPSRHLQWTISQLVKIHPKKTMVVLAAVMHCSPSSHKATLFGVTSSYSVDNHHLRTHVYIMSANQDKSWQIDLNTHQTSLTQHVKNRAPMRHGHWWKPNRSTRLAASAERSMVEWQPGNRCWRWWVQTNVDAFGGAPVFAKSLSWWTLLQ